MRLRHFPARPNIGTVMLFPYARILPLHLTILAGFFVAGSLIGVAFFLVVKAVADLMMHAVEHSGALEDAEV